MESDPIYYAKTVYGQEEIDAVVQCLTESTQMGKYSRRLERQIAKLFEKKYGIYTNSGSSALYLAIESLNLPQGSEVITPALTFSTTVGSLVKNNLVPIFIDVEPFTFCIDHNQIEENISSNTKAILAPNLLGNLCNWPIIRKIANKYNLVVIEDSADTLGAKLAGKSSGAFSDISITSFYGSHIINCAGNGGALAVNSKDYLREAKLLRSWGRSSSLFDEKGESIENRFNISLDGIEYDSKFVFEKIGYNVEGSEIGAAFGLIQLKNLSKNIKERQSNFRIQQKFFKNHSEFFITPKELECSSSGWLAYPIIIRESVPFSRKDFQIFLEKKRIQTRVVFTGNIIRQPMCKQIKKITVKNGYPNSDRVMKQGVLLPVHHGMSKLMFERLHECIEEFISNY